MRTPFISPTKSDARLGKIPKIISSPEIEFKPRASSSPTFTGRKDYLTKLRDFFDSKPDEPIRRKGFLLYGMGGIGKTQICLKFIEENTDLWVLFSFVLLAYSIIGLDSGKYFGLIPPITKR